ncbi:branched-chain amino acid ABC transporter permease [Leptospira interrogans]
MNKGTETVNSDSQTVRGWNLEIVGIVLVAIFFLITPFFVYPVFLMKAMTYAILGMSVNLLLGYVGMLSFGHAAFFGMSGYIFGHFVKVYDMGLVMSLVTAVAGGTLLGVAFAAIAVRRIEFYFAMTTLALAQLVYFFCVQAPFTGGDDGLQGIPRGEIFGISMSDNMNIYFFIFVMFLLCLMFTYRIINSPFGEVLKAIRENSDRVTSLGYNPMTYKFIAFVLSAFLASIGGALKALVFQITALPDVHWLMSGDGVLMALVGGIGTLIGPVVGALFIVVAQNGLAEIGVSVVVMQGILFMATVLLFRKGIIGELARLKKWLR